MRKQWQTLARLWGFAAGVRWRIAAALLLGALASAAAIGLIATAAFLISKASQQPPILTLSVAIVGVRFFGISRGVARYSERLVGHDAAFRVQSQLRVEVYRRLELLAPTRVPFYRSGDLFSRFVSDVDTVQDLFLRVIPPYVIALSVGVCTVGFIAWLAPLAGLLTAVGLVVAGLLVPRLAARASLHAERGLAADRAEAATETLLVLDSLPELVVAGTAERQQRSLRETLWSLRTREARLTRGGGVGSALSAFVAGATVIGCLLAGQAALRSGSLDGVLLAVVVLTPLAAFDLVTPLPGAYQQWLAVQSSAERLFALLDESPAIEEPTTPHEPPPGPLFIRVEGVSARWPDATGLALHDVTLDIRAHERIAIVGPSGSGKTTLASLLVRFLSPEDGRIRWNEMDVVHLDTDEARRHVGLLTQDSHIFDTTIEENLRIGRRDATTSELESALSRAELLQWVRELPEGMATRVGEHGARLSGGQRQRLCLARLLLAEFPVVVLDEPAEHLDLETADRLTADLLTVTAGQTTVMITHRMTGLEGVDEIVVLSGGRVAERGTHDDLLAADGWYADVWRREQADIVGA